MRLGKDEEDYYRLGPTFATAAPADVLGLLTRSADAGGSAAGGSGAGDLPAESWAPGEPGGEER